ncbi:DUF4390 domain-containing protein [Bordetella sp. 02P26C-1]|uniref:DUF4390 domain-containing protein n=1 Tax=Bordetella sp. 02P26C-1 TaxID=2683195 RepID=UPI00135272E2|nr:DUF4390 domain-containing protein [Bordetella sp. 02P26C-1]MVW79343.1 DUF4390 domain-containing protein [Bordetella sp. 02P26C-1]
MMSRLLCGLLLWFLVGPFGLGQAYAQDPRVTRIEPTIVEGKLELDADIEIQLNEQLRDAAERGLALYFTADIVINRERWWWFDESVVNTSRTWRVQYNALTRQWRVAMDSLSLPVSSLDEAMGMVRHIRHWVLADVDQLDREVAYQGQLRMRLDTSHLTRPFQVNALNSSSWSLETPWADFSFELAKPRDPS